MFAHEDIALLFYCLSIPWRAAMHLTEQQNSLFNPYENNNKHLTQIYVTCLIVFVSLTWYNLPKEEMDQVPFNIIFIKFLGMMQLKF